MEESGLQYQMSTEKAYSTDSNIWGATHEAKDLEFLNKGCTIVDPIMGVPSGGRRRGERRKGDSRFDEGMPVAINGSGSTIPSRLVTEAEHGRRPHGLGMSRSDREPDHRGEEPGDL